jgi:hypothetical protein
MELRLLVGQHRDAGRGRAQVGALATGDDQAEVFVEGRRLRRQAAAPKVRES